MNLNRKCIKCNVDFVLKPHANASNVCYKCKREYQKEYAQKKLGELSEDERYKSPYPYDEAKRQRVFADRRKELSKMKDRDEWRAFFNQRLYEMENDDKEILNWILDRRSQEAMAEDKIPRKYKKDEYEDTRITYQNKSWFD